MHPETWAKIRAMVAFIKTYQEQTGCSPSRQEIADALGTSMANVANRLMPTARARNLIDYRYGSRREIKVLP